jgi:hypothetical protein
METGDPSGILSTVILFDKNTSQLLRYRTTAGTSMAAPHVSGVAALVWGAFPGLNHHQVRARIMNGVDRLSGLTTSTITGGRLNAYGALSAADIPAIFSVVPPAPARGETITITGVNFGSVSERLTLGDLEAPVTTWSDSEITAVVPASAVAGRLSVNGEGGGFPLDVTIKPITLTLSATPAEGPAPLTVAFTAAATSPETELKGVEWDFGSGIFESPSAIPEAFNASRSFNDPGSFIVRVRVTDQIGRVAIASKTVTVGQGAVKSGGSGGGCFIATAAYGSYLDPKVILLRDFRDSCLLTNSPGRAFVSLYYRFSPPIAGYIAEREWLKACVRILLLPLVLTIEYPLFTGLFMTTTALVLLRRRSYLPACS